MRAEEPKTEAAVERVHVDDLPQILRLAASCPEAPAWPAEAWQSFVDPGQAGSAMERVLFATRSSDGEFSGCIAVTLLEQTTELELLLVHPRWRRRGLGRLMMLSWFAWVQQAGVTEAVLEVRASNVAAQTLYRTFGFTDQGWRSRYYHHPSEDGLLMRRVFAAVAGGSG